MAVTPKLLEKYLRYVGDSESPIQYHRWSMISAVGALIGRAAYVDLGHSTIYPNQYILLVGDPGTRKSTAISIMEKLFRATGYSNIASGRTNRKLFMKMLASGDFNNRVRVEQGKRGLEAAIDAPLTASLQNTHYHHCYMLSGEFSNFIGSANENFIYLLTDLWDNLDEYNDPLSGVTVKLRKPTLNLLSGTTTQSIMDIFPPQALNQGILTRMILVHGYAREKIPFPKPPNKVLQEEIITYLKAIRFKFKGEVKFTTEAVRFLEKVYREMPEPTDVRLKHYHNRRFTHLLKLCIICAAMNKTKTVNGELALYANTLLTYTEDGMGDALGQYGLSNLSVASTEIMDILNKTERPITAAELWERVQPMLGKQSDLTIILHGLQEAKRIQPHKFIKGELQLMGFLPWKNSGERLKEKGLVDYMMLEEMQ